MDFDGGVMGCDGKAIALDFDGGAMSSYDRQ